MKMESVMTINTIWLFFRFNFKYPAVPKKIKLKSEDMFDDELDDDVFITDTSDQHEEVTDKYGTWYGVNILNPPTAANFEFEVSQ